MKQKAIRWFVGGVFLVALMLGLLVTAAAGAKSTTSPSTQQAKSGREAASNTVTFDKLSMDDNDEHLINLPLLMQNWSALIHDKWASSGHADAESESFTHWDEEEPPEIPVSCAKCHSTYGFWDFLGADGSTAGTVDKPAPAGSVVECTACHQMAAEALTTVSFNSGSTVSGLGREAVCMQCHQARNSSVSLDAMVAGYGDDEKRASFYFLNPHYFTAADTLLGSQARGVYEYQGQVYRGRSVHVEDMDTCIACHDEHTLEVKVTACGECHRNVKVTADLVKIRTTDSDFDGDGDVREGIAGELVTIQQALYEEIERYAKEVNGAPIVYDIGRYPYFFHDTDGDGEPDEDEISYENRYGDWTPRLLRAVYNYNYLNKESGAYAHNSRYMLQVMFDSLDDMGGDVSGMLRPE